MMTTPTKYIVIIINILLYEGAIYFWSDTVSQHLENVDKTKRISKSIVALEQELENNNILSSGELEIIKAIADSSKDGRYYLSPPNPIARLNTDQNLHFFYDKNVFTSPAKAELFALKFNELIRQLDIDESFGIGKVEPMPSTEAYASITDIKKIYWLISSLGGGKYKTTLNSHLPPSFSISCLDAEINLESTQFNTRERNLLTNFLSLFGAVRIKRFNCFQCDSPIIGAHVKADLLYGNKLSLRDFELIKDTTASTDLSMPVYKIVITDSVK